MNEIQIELMNFTGEESEASSIKDKFALLPASLQADLLLSAYEYRLKELDSYILLTKQIATEELVSILLERASSVALFAGNDHGLFTDEQIWSQANRLIHISDRLFKAENDEDRKKRRFVGANDFDFAIMNDDISKFDEKTDINSFTGFEIEIGTMRASPTLLGFAAFWGSKNCVEYLLAHNADPKKKSHNMWNAFHWAIAGGHNDLVEAPLFGSPYVAALCFRNETMEWLFDQKERQLNDGLMGLQPIHGAAISGNFAAIQTLLQRGVNPGIGSLSSKYNAFHYAVQYRHTEIVKYLLDKVDINAAGNDGWTALHFAAQNGDLEICKLLVENKVDVNIPSVNAWLPIHWAVKNLHFEIVQLLLDYGALLNYGDIEGSTPLAFAVKAQSKEMVELLLKTNADPLLYDKSGSAPLHIAVDTGNIDIVNLLLENQNDIDLKNTKQIPPIGLAMIGNRMDIIETLIKHGADPSVRFEGSTPLHQAINTRNEDLALALIATKSIKVNMVDTKKNTALHLAVINKMAKVVEALMKKKASYKVKNKQGKTPYDIALEMKVEEIINMFPEDAKEYATAKASPATDEKDDDDEETNEEEEEEEEDKGENIEIYQKE